MREEMSRAWRDVDLDALAHNARVLQGALAPGCRLMAVVKADAYGHGAFPVAHRLEQEGVEAFAVACLAEGMDLRRMGVRGKILILGYTPPEEAPLLCRWRLTQTVVDEHHGQALEARGLPLAVHLALDTGMHRLGVPAEDHGALERLYALPHLKIEGVFSHLCVSDSLEAEDVAFTHLQLERFTARSGGSGTTDTTRERPTSRPATASGTCRPSPAATPGQASPCMASAAAGPRSSERWTCGRCCPSGPGWPACGIWSRGMPPGTTWPFTPTGRPVWRW